jgi:glucose 1-dehydrogenase
VWEPRRAAILGSGTIGLLMALATRLRGLELSVLSLPKKPYRNADLVEELGGVYASSEDQALAELSAERGPFDLITDATGFSPIRLGGGRGAGPKRRSRPLQHHRRRPQAEIESDKINQSFVLGNKVMVGTVNASPADFRSGVDDLIKAQALFRGWLDKLLTTPIQGLERYEEMIRALTEDREAIKVYVEVDASQ